MTTTAPTTAAELERLYLPNKQVELVRGQLVVRELPGTWHGRISARLALLVDAYAEEHELGAVFAQDTAFKIAAHPDTVCGADVALVRTDQLHRIPLRGFAELAPDLVAEVLSPDDRPGDVLAKAAEWLNAGTRLVWVIDPQCAEAWVYRPDGTVSVIAANGALDGEGVVPGFSCLLREVLER